MPAKLNSPLWPRSKLNLTTPFHLLLLALSALVGVVLYRKGFTYEGATLVYMLGGVIIAWPYYAARFTWQMTSLTMASFIPISIWAQNKAVEAGSWHYRPHDEYVIWITRDGEGWWHWTRHLWLGNDMPAMEYLFYPLFCLFQITAFAMFNHVLPKHWFESMNSKWRHAFPYVFTLVLGTFIAIYFLYPNPNTTDYLYWLTAFGYGITLFTYVFNSKYRAYCQTPAFWLWLITMGGLFMVSWEFFHCCINHDWIYNRENTFPFYLTYKGTGVPVSELLGYLTTATTFKALMLLLLAEFGTVVIKAPHRIMPCYDSPARA